MLLAVLGVVVLLLHGTPLAAQTVVFKLSGRDVLLWRPAEVAERQPVIIFSHGYTGCAAQSSFLTAALAQRGYWVFAPNHNDARCGNSRGSGGPDVPFQNPRKWSDKTYVDRAQDIRAVIAGITNSQDFAARVDLERIGLVGHSLGGYTVVGLAGGWASWKIPGVKAVLALSPYTEPFRLQRTLGGISAPIMFQGGTLDLALTPPLRRAGGTYDSAPQPKYYVELARAGHFAWTELNPAAHQVIIHYSLAFLDRYLRGAATTFLTSITGGVAELRYDSELGSDRLVPRRAR